MRPTGPKKTTVVGMRCLTLMCVIVTASQPFDMKSRVSRTRIRPTSKIQSVVVSPHQHTVQCAHCIVFSLCRLTNYRDFRRGTLERTNKKMAIKCNRPLSEEEFPPARTCTLRWRRRDCRPRGASERSRSLVRYSVLPH